MLALLKSLLKATTFLYLRKLGVKEENIHRDPEDESRERFTANRITNETYSEQASGRKQETPNTKIENLYKIWEKELKQDLDLTQRKWIEQSINVAYVFL